MNANTILEIKARLTQDPTVFELKNDVATLLAEVNRLNSVIQDLSVNTGNKVIELGEDMIQLEQITEALRQSCTSAEFERDATVGLLCKMASKLGMQTGRTDNRAVIDLPAGQVSWEYLDEEAHLFAELSPYPAAIETTDMQEIYTRVMNPAL